MKAEELMIGDWVCYSIPNKYYTKVQEIRCTHDGEEYYIRCHRDAKDTFLEQLKYDDFSVDIIHPIPLTPEILEKNGFEVDEKDENMLKWRWSVIDDCISYDKSTGKLRIFYVPGLAFVKMLEFVHELQHALRLCKIDKEIVL